MAASIRIDRIRCQGHGLCAELLPELIELDEWGYPILRKGDVPDELEAHARRAVAVCPVLALWLERPQPGYTPPRRLTRDQGSR